MGIRGSSSSSSSSKSELMNHSEYIELACSYFPGNQDIQWTIGTVAYFADRVLLQDLIFSRRYLSCFLSFFFFLDSKKFSPMQSNKLI